MGVPDGSDDSLAGDSSKTNGSEGGGVNHSYYSRSDLDDVMKLGHTGTLPNNNETWEGTVTIRGGEIEVYLKQKDISVGSAWTFKGEFFKKPKFDIRHSSDDPLTLVIDEVVFVKGPKDYKWSRAVLGVYQWHQLVLSLLDFAHITGHFAEGSLQGGLLEHSLDPEKFMPTCLVAVGQLKSSTY
ncbi:hypothetical protein SISNIDRAFT_465213 [Sistotremastrum niveocremeum HHB9708]|uniref:Uncharacterized protein n=1 Tax=Sistotremastrum niveocremeum HHB9708 TaxID=1314777 RepID=A0A164WEB8_9AGAM|nr:hypothetical protein SISNIDRAFT_465213 [Sistotremastrum niveocremeum HHB9708]